MLLMRLQWIYKYTRVRVHAFALHNAAYILYANAEMTNVTLLEYLCMCIIYDLYVLSLILPQKFVYISTFRVHSTLKRAVLQYDVTFCEHVFV